MSSTAVSENFDPRLLLPCVAGQPTAPDTGRPITFKRGPHQLQHQGKLIASLHRHGLMCHSAAAEYMSNVRVNVLPWVKLITRT